MQVTVRNTLYSNPAFVSNTPYFVYEGEEVKTPSWVDYPALALTTGRKGRDFPVRIIDREDIISIDDKLYEFVPVVESKKEYTVMGSKGDVYTVTVDGKHKTCNCKAFQFRRNCRHITEI